MAKYHGKRSRLVKPGKKLRSSSIKIPFSTDITGWIGDFFNAIITRFREFRLILGGIAVGLIIAFCVILVIDFYRVKALANFKPSVTTKIFDKNGILISELFRQKREVVPIEKIPKELIEALIAIEDNEFHDHFGINIKGIVRAFFINVFSGSIRQGGSTIPQQLAKILLTSRKRNIYRKIKEAFIAIMIEVNYTKEEILSLYLNQIFLGHGTYGVESASRLYFNKHVWELNPAECALMASLPSSPNVLSPIRHPKRSMQRHKVVLAKMVEMGFMKIPDAEKAYLDFWPDYLNYISDIAPSLNTWSSRIDRAPWFTEFIRRKLVKQYGDEMVYDKGLLVYTTLDLSKQIAGQEVLSRALEKQTGESAKLAFKNEDYIIDNYSKMVNMFSLLFDVPPLSRTGSRKVMKINDYMQENIADELDMVNYCAGFDTISDFLDMYRSSYYKDKDFQKVEGCLISINHNNGYIEALVGGSEFTSINQLNRVIQAKRQPGSAIKPLLYSAAMESGNFSPATAVLDSPIIYLDNEGGDWLPENYEGEYYGLIRLRSALAMSINVVSIRIADALGIDYVLKYYSRLLKMDDAEMKRRVPRNFSIALGSFEVSPYELTRAYSIIANGGRDVIPFSIRYIEDREGKILENREEDVKKAIEKKRKEGSLQLLNSETAQIMVSMLKSVVGGGTGSGASIGRPAAGKTGTTNNWKDAWFVGFVPQITTGIWIGYDKLGLSLGIGQSGGSVAAPVWGDYMRRALKNEKASDFPVFAPLTEAEVCKRSGLLPSENCSQRIKEFFGKKTIPEKVCEMCENFNDDFELAKKGPRDNISQKQKQAVIRNIMKNRDDSIIDNVDNDLLDKP